MNNEPEYTDELEQLLHEQLRDFVPQAPERVWSRIEAQLPERRRRPVLWLWITGVGMAALLTGMAYHFGKGNSSVGLATPDQRLQPVPPLIESQAVPPKPGIESKIPQKYFYGKLPIVGISNENKPNAIGPLIGKEKPVADILSKSTTIESARVIEIYPIAPPSTLLPIFDQLPGATLHTLEYSNRAVPIFLKHAPTKPLHELRWQIGTQAGPLWQWQRGGGSVTDNMNHLAFAERSEGPATGWQMGLSANFTLTPQWRLGTGFWQRTTTQVSSHNATLRLMDGICLNPYDSDPKEYEFKYTLLSRSNESYLTVRIAQVDSISTMPTDEPFLLTMHTSRQRTDWVLPLTIQHTFGHKNWQGFVQGGGAINVPGKIAVQVEHFSEECIDLCFAGNHIPLLTAQDRGKISLSWMLGAGLDYRLNRHWSLNTTPTLFGRKGQIGLLLNSGVNLKF